MKNTNIKNIYITKHPVPILSYLNADTEKSKVLKACKNKSGIYMWTNKFNNKIYIGSALNLRRRLLEYYNTNKMLKKIKRTKSMIFRALLKYGYSNFKLDIIEFCNPFELITRGQHYIDLIKPQYNILKFAGSLAGFKYSEDSKELIRAARLGSVISEKSKLMMSASNHRSVPVIIKNNYSGELKEFTSLSKAALYLGTYHSKVSICIKKQKPYKGIYTIMKKF